MRMMLRILLVLACSLPGFAVAADIDEMLSDAIARFRDDVRTAKIDVDKVAIYAIEPDRGGQVNVSLLQDQLEAALLETGRFKVINRKALKALLEEQALSLTGVVDEAQMVKAGKLVGARGFFYGSVEVQPGKVLLTMKLIEVESSAVVYSRKFAGESRGFARLGIGWFYSIAPGLSLDYRVFYKDGMTGVETDLLPEPGGLDGISGSSFASFSLSYKQGFQSMPWAQLGIDLSFAHYMGSPSEVSSADGETQPIPPADTATYNAIVSLYGVTAVGVTPKLFLTTKDILGTERDIFNPYLGVSITVFAYTTHFGGWCNISGANSSNMGYQEIDSSFTSTAIMPVFGIEVNATKKLSAFVEGAFLPSDSKPGEGEKGLYLDPNLHGDLLAFVPSGLFVNLGIRYYFNLF